MGILLTMGVGIALGLCLNLKKLLKANGILQMVLTGLLIFSMGVSLGAREGFLQELNTLGLKSAAYMLGAVVCSILLVYGLTRLFFQRKGGGKP